MRVGQPLYTQDYHDLMWISPPMWAFARRPSQLHCEVYKNKHVLAELLKVEAPSIPVFEMLCRQQAIDMLGLMAPHVGSTHVEDAISKALYYGHTDVAKCLADAQFLAIKVL